MYCNLLLIKFNIISICLFFKQYYLTAFIFLLLSRRLKNLLGIFLYLIQSRSFFKLAFKLEFGSSSPVGLTVFLLFFVLLTNSSSVTSIFSAAGSDGLFSYFGGDFGGSIFCLGGDNGDNFKFLELGSISLILEISIIYLLIILTIFFLFKKFIYFIYILKQENSVF